MSQRLPTSMRSSPSPPQRQGAAGGTRGPVLFAAPLVLPLPLKTLQQLNVMTVSVVSSVLSV